MPGGLPGGGGMGGFGIDRYINKINHAIRWKVIYPVDSVIHLQGCIGSGRKTVVHSRNPGRPGGVLFYRPRQATIISCKG